MKRLFATVLVIFFLLFSVMPIMGAEKDTVMVIPLNDTVEKGLSSFIARSFAQAEEENVDLIVIEIDTPGGRIDAAEEIKDTIMSSSIPTAALIKGRAISAGSFIALSCDRIAMQPGSTIGDAEPLIGGERAGEKVLSAWKKELASVAEAHGRDAEIAMAFADRDMEIPGVIEKGKLLTLTPADALKYGMADFQHTNREELLEELGYKDARIISADPTIAEKISRFATNPIVAPILLTLGISGIVIEVITVGFGVFGIIGLGSLLLFFGGHLFAGFSGWEAMLVFLLGLILMTIEVFVPGFGIFGIGGILALVTSIILVSPSFEAALISLTIAIIGTVILVLLSFKFLQTRSVWKNIVLANKQVAEDGYTTAKIDFRQYIDKEGIVLTTLRPAGIIELEDGFRLDAVSEGAFIEKDSRVKIVKIEGNKIITRKID